MTIRRVPFIVSLLPVMLLATGLVRGDERAKADSRFVPVDLQAQANHRLDRDFHTHGNNLRVLPRGKQQFGQVEFLIGDKFIFLAGKRAPQFPESAEGIPVNTQITRLHFLQGGGWGTPIPDGTPVGKYVVHYDDMTLTQVPIVYGKDLRDWWSFDDSPPTSATVAWTCVNHASRDFQGQRLKIRLFRMMWENPRPEKRVTSFDFVSFNDTICSPFLIAVTGELTSEVSAAVDQGDFPRVTLVKTASDLGSLDPRSEWTSTLEKLRDCGAFLEFDDQKQLKHVSLSGPGPRSGIARGSNPFVALVSEIPTVELLDLAYSAATDDALLSVKELPNLRSLNLNLTGVTNQGLQHLKGMQTLERLCLHSTWITDAGVSHLSQMSQLKVLDLSNTQITDSGLLHLKSLLSLEEVDLRKTKTTAAGVTELRQALPNARIVVVGPN